MKTYYVYYAGGYLGQVQAKTAAAALRKARYQWGSSGEWTDAQLKKFAVRSNSGGRNPSQVRARTFSKKRDADNFAMRRRWEGYDASVKMSVTPGQWHGGSRTASSRQYTVYWSKKNSGCSAGNATTLKNMAVVRIQKLPNGQVRITGRKMRRKR